MTDLVKYKVAREHLGDEITDEGVKPKEYVAGDTREADPTVVTTLVKSGVLIAPKGAKSDEPHQDKSEAVPTNKGGADKTKDAGK